MRFTRAGLVFEALTLVAAGVLIAGAISRVPALSREASAQNMPTATSTQGNYVVGPDGVLYNGVRVPGADAGSFFVSPTPGFEDAGMDRAHFYYGTTTLGAVADFSLIPPPTFSTSTARFAITIIHREALTPSGCARAQSTGSCAPRVTVSYPQIIGTTSPAIARINAQIKQEYTKSFSGAVAEATANPSTSKTNGYQADIEFLGYYAPKIYPFITFAFVSGEYNPGAAHGISSFSDETFSLATGGRLTPTDIFTPGSNYGGRVATYLDEAFLMQERNAASRTENGIDCTPWPTDPRNSESFVGKSNFYIADAGFVVVSQGSTYPCSGYELDTVIPFSYLSRVLSATGPLQSQS